MMDDRESEALRLVRDAMDLEPNQRAAFLKQRCAGDDVLVARALDLLGSIDPDDARTEDSTSREATDPLVGSMLGPFLVAERIGRGGMGVVYRGLREGSDFRQEVALKLIRHGFDFDDIRVRFLRERRILARLDHPHLARFIDGGVSAEGRPWFALDFVRGEAITHWCDARQRSVRERVKLFVDVCAAVQYAHAQLVVHRDLKPGNILVDLDGHTQLLDFGIARLLGDEEGGTTLTAVGPQGMMTPEYAAPEQFAGEPAGVATDVYALGVILFELVSGARPYAVSRTDPAAAGQTIREQLPQPLTQALARDGNMAIEQRLRARGTTLRAFRKTVRGDLGRILGKALAKEPERRYVSVQSFADDLSNWLEGAPVRVSGNGIGYRLRKFVARHRVAAGFAAIAALAAIAGMATTVWQMREAQAQRDHALAEARRSATTRSYLMLMFREAGGLNEATSLSVKELFKNGAERLFDEFRDRPEEGQDAALALSELYVQLGDLQGAKPLLEKLLQWPGIETNPRVQADALHNLAQVELALGQINRGSELLQQAQALWIGRPGPLQTQLNESRLTEAKIERMRGNVDKTIDILQQAIVERRQLLEGDDLELGNHLNSLAIALLQAGRYAEAEARAGEAYAVFDKFDSTGADGRLGALNSRANAAMQRGRMVQALEDHRHVAEMTRALYGETTKLAAALASVGSDLIHLGRIDEAGAPLHDALRIARGQGGDRTPLTVAIQILAAEQHARTGHIDDAETEIRTALDIVESDYPKMSVLLGSGYRARAFIRLAKNRLDEALADYHQSVHHYRAAGASSDAYIARLEPLRKQLNPP